MRPKVSVIIPVYNVEEYLPKCLDSIINQTLKDIEIIVVNDGTPDNSQDIIDKYKKKDKRIISIIKENGGQGSARNFGLQKAHGEYISYVDSDDWIDSEMLEKMYNKAVEKDLDIVICGYKNIYKDKCENVSVSDEIKKDISIKNNLISSTVMVWDKIYKRTFLTDSGVLFPKDKIWYEDLNYSAKLLALTDKIDHVDEPFYNYLIREQSTMRNDKVMKNLDLIIIFDDIIDYYRKNNMYEAFYEELEFLAIDHFSYGMTRVMKSKASWSYKRKALDELHKYLKKHFYNLNGNKYLCKMSRNRNLIYKLLLNKKYRLVDLIFKLRGNK